MKLLLATLGGFALSLGMFAGGLVLATHTLTAKPVAVQAGPTQDVAALWTATPRKVDPAKQEFERVAAAPLPPEKTVPVASDESLIVASMDEASSGKEVGFDNVATNALSPHPREPSGDVQLEIAHQEWCANRYRSYRSETNSFTPYSGGQRTCVSPYSGAAEELAGDFDGAQYVSLAGDTRSRAVEAESDVWIESWHVQSCFDRYRSYRPEDNSYQPIGGGPRLQCR